jgi:hypothetical protein
MARSSNRPDGQVQTTRPVPTPPLAPAVEAPAPAGLRPGWRVTLLLWLAAFGLLLATELVAFVVKVVRQVL